MKHILPFLLAFCLLLTLTACTLSADVESSESTGAPTTESIPETTEAPTEAPAPEATEEAAFAPYTVMICRADFPIHSSPDYDTAPIDTVRMATLYTILEERTDEHGNLWGKLKSGTGWVDLTRNQAETTDMPPVTVNRAEHTLVEDTDFYFCRADQSEYAYNIVFWAHQDLTNLRFFTVNPANNFEKDEVLFQLDIWDETTPLMVSVSFPGSASFYGLEFTDSQGITHSWSVYESGRNGGVEMGQLYG